MDVDVLRGSALLVCLALAVGCAECEGPAAAAPDPSQPAAVPGPITFQRFHYSSECQRMFQELAAWRPRWFRAGSLGESVQGRQIPYLAVSDFSSKRPKAGYWIDGAIHGGELGSAEVALAVAETLRLQIAASQPHKCLTQVVFYLVPVINVDGHHLSMNPPYMSQRRNLRPVDDDGDGRFDEDGLGGSDPPGGIDLNRNFPIGSYRVRGQEVPAHTPATLEPETRAVIRFWKKHPEIQLAVSYHTSAEAFIRPFGVSDPDAGQYDAVLSVYRRIIGGSEWKIPPKRFRGLVDSHRLRGVTIEWFYRERNALAFTIEMAHTPRDDVGLLVARVAAHARFLFQLAEMLPLTGRG